MKALRACVAILAVGTLLVGCGRDWEEDVRFKVTRINPEHETVPGRTAPPYVVLALDQEDPKGLVPLDTAGAPIDQFPAGIKVDDVVVCKVRQVEENNADGLEPETRVGPCRSA
ncbi:hypothetical protein AB0425_29595 [Actinosynnema sp. NPDC051121]|nr:hypothetical protein [Saccharothrix sp.]